MVFSTFPMVDAGECLSQMSLDRAVCHRLPATIWTILGCIIVIHVRHEFCQAQVDTQTFRRSRRRGAHRKPLGNYLAGIKHYVQSEHSLRGLSHPAPISQSSMQAA